MSICASCSEPDRPIPRRRNAEGRRNGTPTPRTPAGRHTVALVLASSAASSPGGVGSDRPVGRTAKSGPDMARSTRGASAEIGVAGLTVVGPDVVERGERCIGKTVGGVLHLPRCGRRAALRERRQGPDALAARGLRTTRPSRRSTVAPPPRANIRPLPAHRRRRRERPPSGARPPARPERVSDSLQQVERKA